MRHDSPHWPEIERAYRETNEPVSSIARRAGIGRGALRGRAAREGWQRSEPVRRGPMPKSPPVASPATYSSAEEYLLAVVCGTEPPDPVRVGAARALLPFQEQPKRRALPAKRTAAEQARHEVLEEAADANDAWNAVVQKTLAEFTGKRDTNQTGD